jgi:hypothetical protein
MGLKELYVPVIILITLLVFIKARRKFGFTFFVVFSIYLISNFFIEFLSDILAIYNLNNLAVYNISILSEGLTFCYLFYSVNRNHTIRKALVITSSVFLLFWVINFFFIQKYNTLNTFTYLFSCINLAVFSLVTIYQFVFQNSFNNPFYNFFFWASIGILFCYLGNIPYLASFNILAIKDEATAISLGIISQVVNSILYFMIITGILCHRPETNYK